MAVDGDVRGNLAGTQIADERRNGPDNGPDSGPGKPVPTPDAFDIVASDFLALTARLGC